jgi:hypothetical protein
VKKIWRGIFKKAFEDPTRGKLLPCGILTPRDKETTPIGIVALLQKSIPEERVGSFYPLRQSLKTSVKIRGMVKGSTLAKNGDAGRGIMVVDQVRQIAVSLPSDIWKSGHRDPLPLQKAFGQSRGNALVVDRDVKGCRHPAKPAQVFLISGDHKL